jgi:hypothetical protein
VTNFTVEAGMISGATGFDAPALRFTWTPPQDPTITAIRFSYKIDGGTVEHQDQCLTPEAGEYTTTKDVVSGKVYVAQATITTVPDRLKTFTPWVTTAAGTGYLSVATVLQELGQNVRDELQRRQQEFDEAFARLEFLAANAGSANIEDIVGRQVFQKQVGQAKAQIVKESGLRATADEALAYDMTLVGARVGTAEASILQEASARATADNAISSILTAVSATADAGTAGGLMQWVATTAPGGVSARFRLEGKATSGGVSRFAGMYLDVFPTTSALTFAADSIRFTDGSSTTLPFVYEGGVLKLAVADIGTVTAGTIKSPDNKFVISLSNGSIEWFD